MHWMKYEWVVLAAMNLTLLGCTSSSAPEAAGTKSAGTPGTAKAESTKATKPSPGVKKERKTDKLTGTNASASAQTPPSPAASANNQATSSPAVAIVNGEKIPDVLFQAELEKRTTHAGEIPEDRLRRDKQTILRKLVNETLIQQAVDAAKITIPEEKLKEAMTEYKSRFESEERFKNYLRHSKISLEDIKNQSLKKLKVKVLLLQRGTLEVTDKEALAFYQKNKRFYVDKAGARASHILVKLKKTASKEAEKAALDKIRIIQKELKSGTPFADVAKKMSEDISAPRGGDQGFFGKGHMVPAFEKAVFSLPLGKVSGPVRTHFGYHLIKVHERREERVRTYEEVRAQIERSLLNKLYLMKRRQLLSDLKNTAVIESLIPDVSY